MPTPNLKTLRSHLKLSRAALAAQLDISTETYARHERMDSPPRITLLAVSLLVILAQKSPKPSLSAPQRDKAREEIARLTDLMARIEARNGPGAVRDALIMERSGCQPPHQRGQGGGRLSRRGRNSKNRPAGEKSENRY